jgi:hypothetical protein
VPEDAPVCRIKQFFLARLGYRNDLLSANAGKRITPLLLVTYLSVGELRTIRWRRFSLGVPLGMHEQIGTTPSYGAFVPRCSALLYSNSGDVQETLLEEGVREPLRFFRDRG